MEDFQKDDQSSQELVPLTAKPQKTYTDHLEARPDAKEEGFDLLRIENIAIPACYFTVGCMLGFSRILLNVYPLDLGATEAQQTTLSTIYNIPAALKVLFGFLSDNVAIGGYRRKPYMILGWVIASSSILSLILDCDLSIYSLKDPPPPNVPSFERLGVCFFVLGFGLWLADVMGDSLVAEWARREPKEQAGNLQSTCYASRFLGSMVTVPLSTVLYSAFGPRSVIYGLFFAPLLMIPLALLFHEERGIEVRSTREHCSEIWQTVCSRSVWQPMGFAYLYNLLQVQNSAWRQFLKTVLNFTEAQLNSLLVVAYVLLWLGTILYKYCFLHTSWRRLYQACILLQGFLSFLQLLLIKGVTFGISPFWFALGEDALADFIAGVQFLPLTIMMVNLCPEGSEGASYAMFTTVWNSALLASPAISTLLLGIWDVKKETLEKNELSGMFKLTILTTCIQTSAFFFTCWLPHGPSDLKELSNKMYSGSRIGGALFLAVLFCSIFYSVGVGILNLVSPGWAVGTDG